MIDGLGKAWEMVQADYERKVNKIGLGERVEQQRLGESSPGIDKWGWCKTKHNASFMDVACGPAPFNVIATIAAKVLPPDNVLGNASDAKREAIYKWKQFGFAPTGEQNNINRFDTVVVLRSHTTPVKHEIATYKDKVRPYFDMWTDFDIEEGFWSAYEVLVKDAIDAGERVIALS